jgi:hypothetical protein
MALYLHTSYRWTTIEDVMKSIKERNRTRRIVDDSLYIKIQGKDPMLCWDSKLCRNVYISKSDWRAASPAIRRVQASVILRIKPRYFQSIAESLGIESKKGQVGITVIPPQNSFAFYSLDDIYDISIEIERRQIPSNNSPSIIEIKRLFSKGYIPYKRTRDGEIIPTWDEGIII